MTHRFSKPMITSIVLLSLAGATVARADDLDDAYAALKDAQTKKDAAEVKKSAVEATRLAKAEKSADRLEYAKQVQQFAEYSLYVTAIGDPGKTVELFDALLELNPKSQYIDQGAGAYLAALSKAGGAKQQAAGATKIIAGDPNNIDALAALTESNPSYATRLVNAVKVKAKPEGMAQADWDKRKNTLLGYGYFVAGSAACGKQTWADCDKNLRAALPLVAGQPNLNGQTLFYLGLSNYQMGKLINDRAKMQEAVKFSEQSAAIAGPMQQQASRNAALMKQELGARGR